jgi:molybdenum cofactor cytidylyltransferase
VEPGNLLLLGYKEEIPIVSAPGCFRSAKPNVVDLILPPMLARYRVSGWEVACMGHGGLLGSTRSRLLTNGALLLCSNVSTFE